MTIDLSSIGRLGGLPRGAASSAAGSNSLDVVEVIRWYDSHSVVGPLSFSAGHGEFISLLGPSGCGKTTVLRSVAGFEALTSGSVLIDGVDVSRVSAHKRRVGLVFQSYALFPHLSIFDNVAFGLRLRKLTKAEIAANVSEVLSMVGLSGLEKRMPAQISGGQQQRVAIARSLVLKPKLLLLDEPLSNLDFKLRVQMRHELRQMQRQLGMTFIYVTHDQTEAMALSDRIVVLRSGRIEQEGTPEAIYQVPKTRFVADFIGTTNFFSGRIEQICGKNAAVRVGPDLVIRGIVSKQKSVGDEVCVCVRPENLRLLEETGAGTTLNAISVTPVSVVFSGDRTEVVGRVETPTSIGPSDVTVVFYLDRRRSLSERAHLSFAPEDAIVVDTE